MSGVGVTLFDHATFEEKIRFEIRILTRSDIADIRFEGDICSGIRILTQNNGLGGANKVCLELGGRRLMTQNSNGLR